MLKTIEPLNLIDILQIIEKYEGKIIFTTDCLENGYLQFININYKNMEKKDFLFLMKRGCFLWEDSESKQVFIMLG